MSIDAFRIVPIVSARTVLLDPVGLLVAAMIARSWAGTRRSVFTTTRGRGEQLTGPTGVAGGVGPSVIGPNVGSTVAAATAFGSGVGVAVIGVADSQAIPSLSVSRWCGS